MTDARAQSRSLNRIIKADKNLYDVALRTRIATDDGALVIYDAPRAEGEPPGQAGYLAYWKDYAADEVYVYGRVIEKRSDLVHALLWLRHDFGIDPHDLAPDVFTDDLPDLPEVDSTDLTEPRAWFLATRDRVMVIVGLWSPEDIDQTAERTYSGTVAAPCRPCAAATAGGDAGALDPPSEDVYEAAVMLVCECCGSSGCPPSCDDNNACTSPDYCDCVCGFCYCVNAQRSCNDGNLCTNDSCNPNTGCVFEPKNCDDGNVCTADRCNLSTGACENNPQCSVKCCPASPGFFCCPNAGDICCSNPNHCCLSTQTCCPGGLECCNPDQTCCNGVCGLKGACCFFDTGGSCSELTSLCCAQQGGFYQGNGTTCTPADLCKPRCDNCQAFVRSFAECVHYNNDPNGTPCSTTECIENLIDTASCTFHPNRIGPPNCNTLIVPHELRARQVVREMPCPAQNVSWNRFFTPYEGCGTNCVGSAPMEEACLVGACAGTLLRGPFERYGKGVCGCP
jgi:hypothetical protein